METTVWARVHRGQSREEGLEHINRNPLLFSRLGCNQFRTGVHEAPSGRTDVIRKAHPHLAGFNVVTPDMQIEKRDVLT